MVLSHLYTSIERLIELHGTHDSAQLQPEKTEFIIGHEGQVLQETIGNFSSGMTLKWSYLLLQVN